MSRARFLTSKTPNRIVNFPPKSMFSYDYDRNNRKNSLSKLHGTEANVRYLITAARTTRAVDPSGRRESRCRDVLSLSVKLNLSAFSSFGEFYLCTKIKMRKAASISNLLRIYSVARLQGDFIERNRARSTFADAGRRGIRNKGVFFFDFHLHRDKKKIENRICEGTRSLKLMMYRPKDAEIGGR